MNSQDKPTAANDNLDQSLETSDAIQQESKKLVDLWSEEDEDAEVVTEFISVETAAKNDAEALEAIAPDDNQVEPKPKKDINLDLDDWDFRNPPEPSIELNVDRESIASAQESEPEVDDLVSQQSQESESLNEINLASSSDSEMGSLGFDELDDFRAVESLTEEPVAEIGPDGLEQPLDNSTDLELDSLGLDELDDFAAFESLTEEPVAEISLDGLDQPALNLDSSPDLELDGLELNELDNLGTAEALDGWEDHGLESLLDLDSGTDSLDSLIMEPTASLDESLESLDTDLDSLLDDQLSTSSTPVTVPNVAAPQPAKVKSAAPPAPSPVKAQTFDQTMRVSVRKLDNLNNLIGELVVKRNRLEDDQERLRRFLDNLLGHVQSLGEAGARMHDMYERSLLEGALMASRQSRANAAVAAGVSGVIQEDGAEEGLDALEMDRFNGFHLLSQEIIELIVRVREAASDIQFVVDETDKVAQTFRQVTSQLQDGMNSSRMVAFGQTADRLPRAIRDISRKQKKQTKLHVEGKDVLIDKMIVEHLYNPMTHLVNNAISHGIEKPEERLKKGKPEVGNIYIRAFIQGNQTVITVRDDGAGIDPEKVKEKAIEKNLVTWAAAQNLSNQQVYELLFHPGFSTKDKADDFAGRGVGMDVVNTDLKKIRGSISTESKVGKGTTFTVRLPLVLSICKALTCVNDNSKIAFPIDGVEDTKEYLPDDIQTNVNGVRCISWKNKLLPLRPLSGLLNYNRQIRRTGIYNANQNNDDTVSVIILRSLDNLLAIEVDEIKTEQEIVIKQIDCQAHRLLNKTQLK